jgi:hypothetical protein
MDVADIPFGENLQSDIGKVRLISAMARRGPPRGLQGASSPTRGAPPFHASDLGSTLVGVGVFVRAAVVLAAVVVPAPASAATAWFPHPAGAAWTFEWTDSVYATTPMEERVTVKEEQATSFRLEWSSGASSGTMGFQESTAGVVNTNWQSTPAPPAFPVLCDVAVRCANSLAGTLFNVTWGSRVPVLAEPLLRGTSWTSRGGADGSVTSRSQYLGQEPVTVPAFAAPVIAGKVRTEVAQTGALGDPYGSGVRFVWWVYGVGPVKVVFEHAGGTNAPVTTSTLVSTNQSPVMPPADANYFPLAEGRRLRYRWTNTKHMTATSVQSFVVGASVNNTARFEVRHVTGPIRVAGSYGFSLRTDGTTNSFASSRVASLVRFPPIGPRFLPKARRRHFFTPFDLMTYGFNPIFPAYPDNTMSWDGKAVGRDFKVYGVTGTAKVVGIQDVKVPAGTFENTLVVRTTMKQEGFPFGSGTRTSWFAPGKGLVKLVFDHGDDSTSTVQLLK